MPSFSCPSSWSSSPSPDRRLGAVETTTTTTGTKPLTLGANFGQLAASRFVQLLGWRHTKGASSASEVSGGVWLTRFCCLRRRRRLAGLCWAKLAATDFWEPRRAKLASFNDKTSRHKWPPSYLANRLGSTARPASIGRPEVQGNSSRGPAPVNCTRPLGNNHARPSRRMRIMSKFGK